MSGVSKLGNNRYLATSKNVNRVLNQLNGILANDNITVQNVTAAGGTATTTISLTAGNFIKVAIAASSTTTLAFTDKTPGIYYILITNPNATITAAPVLSGILKPSTANFPTASNAVSLSTLVCDGTNIYELSKVINLT
jgi:hypothetical protein